MYGGDFTRLTVSVSHSISCIYDALSLRVYHPRFKENAAHQFQRGKRTEDFVPTFSELKISCHIIQQGERLFSRGYKNLHPQKFRYSIKNCKTPTVKGISRKWLQWSSITIKQVLMWLLMDQNIVIALLIWSKAIYILFNSNSLFAICA
jgi:hypothetical protein